MALYNPTIEEKAIETPKRKVPYAAKQRIKDEMTVSQKNGITQWNAMITVLQENNLMEDKQG